MIFLLFCMLCLSGGTSPSQLFILENPASLNNEQVLLFRGVEFHMLLGRPNNEDVVIDSHAGNPGEYAVVSERLLPVTKSPSDYGTVLYSREGAVFVRLNPTIVLLPDDPVISLSPLPVSETNPALSQDVSYDPFVEQIVSQVNQDSIFSIIGTLESFQNRFWSSDSFTVARDWTIARFQSMGYEAEIQSFPLGQDSSENVIVTVPGWLYPNREWIIGAHLDSGNDPYGIYPGADDNASGVAAVLEAARAMQPYRFEYTVKYILWGAEEIGCVGSKFYADQAVAAGDSVMGYLNVLMIMYAPVIGPLEYDMIGVAYNEESQTMCNLYNQTTDIYVPELKRTFIYSSWGFGDAGTFWARNMDAINLQASMAYISPYYHESTDVLENYLEYFPFGTNVTSSAVAFIATLAQPIEMGIEEGSQDPSVTISPSPSSSMAYVTVSGSFIENASVSMFDITGRVVASCKLTTDGFAGFDVSRLSSGVYLVTVAGDGDSNVGRCRLVVCH